MPLLERGLAEGLPELEELMDLTEELWEAGAGSLGRERDGGILTQS